MEEENTDDVLEPVFKKSNKKTFRIISVISVVILLVVLILYKVNNTDFQTRYVFIIGIIVAVVGVVMFFSVDIYNKFKNRKIPEKTESGIPPAASPEEVLLKIRDVVKSRRNMIKNIGEIIPFSIGKNEIYAYTVKLVYPDSLYKKDEEIEDIIIVINANYLQSKTPAVSRADIKLSRLKNIANGLSTNPDENPIVEETETHDPTSGRTTKHKKTTPTKKSSRENKRTEEIT